MVSSCWKPQTFAYIIKFRTQGEGARGAHHPWDDLRFSNTTGILQKKKKLCALLVLNSSKRRVHPLLKGILDPPLEQPFVFDHPLCNGHYRIEGCLSAAQLLFVLVVDADFSFVHVFSRKFFSFFLFFHYVRFLIQK